MTGRRRSRGRRLRFCHAASVGSGRMRRIRDGFSGQRHEYVTQPSGAGQFVVGLTHPQTGALRQPSIGGPGSGKDPI